MFSVVDLLPMQTGFGSPAQLLGKILARKRAKNSSYSVSALARDTGMAQSLLARFHQAGPRNFVLAEPLRSVSDVLTL